MQHLAQSVTVRREQLGQGIAVSLAESATEVICRRSFMRHGFRRA
jgi:hypothetical protein